MIPCLLVTGDRVARDIVKTGLDQAQAFDVEVHTDAWALDLAREHTLGLVIADTSLGDGSDGIAFLRSVRELQPDAELWLITRGKNQGRYLAKDKSELGITTLLNLPLDATEFFRAVKKTIERQRDQQPVA